MPDKTWDVVDPRDLPYRFVYSPKTKEVFVVAFHPMPVIVMVFENNEAFHRFLVEGNKTDDLITEKVMQEALNILKSKQLGDA